MPAFNPVILPKRSADSIGPNVRLGVAVESHRSSLVVRSGRSNHTRGDRLPVLHGGQRLPHPDAGVLVEPH